MDRLMTPAASIFSISCQNVCFKWTGMGLQGYFLGYCRGRSRKDGCCRLCMYLPFGMISCTGYEHHSGGRYSNLDLASRSCSWKTVSHDKRMLPSSLQHRLPLWWAALWLYLTCRSYICQWDLLSVLYTLWDLCHSLLILLCVDHWIQVYTQLSGIRLTSVHMSSWMWRYLLCLWYGLSQYGILAYRHFCA